jgi:hypothetical protein
VEPVWRDSASSTAWLVQIAVWRDMDLHPGGLVAADFGAHVLRLVRGAHQVIRC